MPNMSETPSKMGELERRRTISTTNTCLSLRSPPNYLLSTAVWHQLIAVIIHQSS